MDLYAELILDHARRPQHAGLREPFDAEVHAINPTCGDEVTLRVQTEGSGEGRRVLDVSYDAQGCSISIAATSVLAEDVRGLTFAEVGSLREAMRAMLGSRGQDAGDPEVLGDAVAFAGVSRYPARVKCALLGWSALTDALARSAPVDENVDNL